MTVLPTDPNTYYCFYNLSVRSPTGMVRTITVINYLQDISSTISVTWEGVWNTSKGEIEAKQLNQE